MMPSRWILALLLLCSTPAAAGEFQVTPMSLDLPAGAKSGAFSVINNGNEKLNCEISIVEWSQDANGEDLYKPTKDLVFFPKLMTVEPHGQHIIRIGVTGQPGATEKTYRLFVTEIPASKNPAKVGETNIKASVGIAFRFSMPIFRKPVQENSSSAVEKIELAKGALKVVIKNKGNTHLRIYTINVTGKGANGKTLFSKEIAGWYILHGLSRSHGTEIPPDVCAKLSRVDVAVEGDNVKLGGSLNVLKAMCGR